MQKRTVAVALAEALARHGVDTIFGQSLPSALLLQTPRAGIRQITYRSENAGGAMADGYARASHRIGVVAAQNGPAATLLVPPMAEAFKASIPLIALVQEVPVGERDRNAFQEFDHHALFASCAKWVRALEDPSRVDDHIDMAITAACSGRPGPVALLLPRDVLTMPAPEKRTRDASLGRYPLDRTTSPQPVIEDAAAVIARADRPIVIAGGGVHLSDASEAVAALQEQASLPVGTTTMGKGAVDELHPLSLGVVSNYMGRASAAHGLRDYIAGADAVVFVGSRTNENGTDGWKAFPREADVIHIDVDSMELGRNYEAAVRLRGDARLSCEALLDVLLTEDLSKRRSARPEVEDLIAKAREWHREAAGALVSSDARPIRPERVMAELDAALSSREATVVADASYSTIWMGNYLRARRPGQRFLSPRGLAGLGWGLPLALGAKAAAPERAVVAIAGDGGLAHVWSEIETAVREELPLVIILLDNGILAYQKHAELVQFGAHTTAIEFDPVDHSAIARACGAQAVPVEDPADLGPAVTRALEDGRTWLIEVRSDAEARPPITAWDGIAD